MRHVDEKKVSVQTVLWDVLVLLKFCGTPEKLRVWAPPKVKFE